MCDRRFFDFHVKAFRLFFFQFVTITTAIKR